jgi:hypothetical protein
MEKKKFKVKALQLQGGQTMPHKTPWTRDVKTKKNVAVEAAIRS